MDEIMGDALVGVVITMLAGIFWPGFEVLGLIYFCLKLSKRAGDAWRSWVVPRRRRRSVEPPPRTPHPGDVSSLR